MSCPRPCDNHGKERGVGIIHVDSQRRRFLLRKGGPFRLSFKRKLATYPLAYRMMAADAAESLLLILEASSMNGQSGKKICNRI
jgi:hypothetical protein